MRSTAKKAALFSAPAAIVLTAISLARYTQYEPGLLFVRSGARGFPFVYLTHTYWSAIPQIRLGYSFNSISFALDILFWYSLTLLALFLIAGTLFRNHAVP